MKLFYFEAESKRCQWHAYDGITVAPAASACCCGRRLIIAAASAIVLTLTIPVGRCTLAGYESE